MFRFTIRDVLWLMVVVGCGSLRADEAGPSLKELLWRENTIHRNDPTRFKVANYVLDHHSGPLRGTQRRILVISWFYDGAGTALQYAVDEDGRCDDVRHVFQHAYQASHKKSLTKDELRRLRVLINKLPNSKADPPIEHTVVVGFQCFDWWEMQVYDARALSDQFEEIIKILGERYETKGRHTKKAN